MPPPSPNSHCASQVSKLTGLPLASVQSVLRLADEGATVPFLARYRKEATGGLDEIQLRDVLAQASLVSSLDKRREAIFQALRKQEQLAPALELALRKATNKADLEELYLPYKAKRRSRAQVARERGLEPLAKALWNQENRSASVTAAAFVDKAKDVESVDAALAGARDLCAERLAEAPETRKRIKDLYYQKVQVTVLKTPKYREKPTPFDQQLGKLKPLPQLASHRWLALCRGESQGMLRLQFDFDSSSQQQRATAALPGASHPSWKLQTAQWVQDAFTRLLLPAAKAEARRTLDKQAQTESIEVFATNLRQLLLAPPLGARTVLGIDPGQRTGCKCTLVSEAGQLLGVETLFLVQGKERQAQATKILLQFLQQTSSLVIAVGNGTHGRETLQFVQAVVRKAGSVGEDTLCVSVNEAGASVYSASDVARREFPDLDVSYRGAVSIARRLQDPLAELVKIDPKSIGVGQYQHDMDSAQLEKRLGEVVESCVHAVGVDLNTASPELLCRVSGLGPKLTDRIVAFRHKQGRFRNRQQLLSIAGLGARAFEQSAGFLRIAHGDSPLDATGVHPERYALVEKMAQRIGVAMTKLLGNLAALQQLRLADFESDDVGAFTLKDIVHELSRPGRDPRQQFSAPQFSDGIDKLEDLAVGMKLMGVVTNVAAFGAFVDIGVHQDGLVHISKLSRTFVRNPSDVVEVGQQLEVEVLQIDTKTKRIGLASVLPP